MCRRKTRQKQRQKDAELTKQVEGVQTPASTPKSNTAQNRRIYASGYDRHGASGVKRSMQGWISPPGSPDDDLVDNLDALRARSRDLFMGSPLATAAIKNIRTNVVGSGLVLNAQIDHARLGMTDDEGRAWERNAEREFISWAGTTLCDASRTLTFGQLQALAIMSALMSGDCFVTLPSIPRPGSRYDLRIHIIEGDCICDPTPLPVDKDVFEGVEVDKWGAPVAYYIAKYHPNAFVHRTIKQGVQEWTRTPAFGSQTGRRLVLHLMPDVERPGQRRGTPLLAQVMEPLKQLERYTEAELMAAVVASMYTVFIRTSTPDAMLGSGIPGGMLLPETEADEKIGRAHV